MKLAAPLLISLCLIGCSTGTNTLGKGDLAENNLHGNIKTITFDTYQADNVNGAKGEKLIPGDLLNEEIYSYNENGKLVRDANYEGSAKRKLTDYRMTYDDKGNMTMRLGCYANGDTVREKFVHAYDNKNNIVRTLQYKNDSLMLKTVNTYDNNNNLVKVDRYNADNSYYKGEKITYNDKGMPLVDERFDMNNKPDGKAENTYDDKNKLTATKFYYGNGIYHDEAMFTYNTYGDKTESYDIDSNKTKLNQANWEYPSYDEHGNWLIQDFFMYSRPSLEYLRKIEYYPQ
jgi:hypothetical protein